jgi:hypothetical protein
MLEQSNFADMKQISVGKDEEKVRARLREEWLPLTKPQRADVLNLSGLTSYAVTRSYEKGRVSLKLALALAQSLHINPYYLTGASDERDLFSDELAIQFLADYGHTDLVVKDKPKRKYNRKAKPVAEEPAAEEPTAAVQEWTSPEPATEAAESDSPEIAEVNDTEEAPVDLPSDVFEESIDITFKAAKKLLKALFMRAKHSEDAKATANQVKKLLMK